MAGQPASGHDAAGAELTTTVTPDTTRTALSPHVYAAAALSPISDPTAAVTLAATPAPVTLKTIVTDVLTWIGLGTLAPYVPVPDLPVPSVIESLWLAVRDFERTYNNQRPTTQLGLSAQGPDGTIGGSLNATDFENDPLGVVQAAASTVVSVVGNVIGFGNAPTAPALSPDGTRAVNVSSSAGLFGTTTLVTVIDTTTGRQVGTPLTLSGAPRYSSMVPLVSADGSHALVTTAATNWFTGTTTTQVTVIDTATGRQVGKTVSLAGNQPGPPVMNAAGTRVLITTTSDDLGTSATTTRASVIDTTTGAQIGTTVSLVGPPTVYPTMSPVLNADGTRALVVTYGYNSATSANTTQVAVINTTTGNQVGNTLILTADHLVTPAVSVAGAFALISTSTYDPSTGTTQFALVNTTTGAQTGSTQTFTGTPPAMVLTNNGTRVLVTTRSHDETTGTDTTKVSVIDTASGGQIGSTLTLDGTGSPVLSAAGGRAVVTTSIDNPVVDTIEVAVYDTTTGTQIGSTVNLTGNNAISTTAAGNRAVITADGYGPTAGSTLVSVINTTTGAQIGSTVSLDGSVANTTVAGATAPPVLNAAGTRAVITTTSYDSATGTSTSRVAVIDTATGAQIGTPLTIANAQRVSTQVSADGTRALITMSPYDFTTGNTTQVAVIDTVTGNRIGTILTIAAVPSDPAMFIANGTRALISTNSYNTATRMNTKSVAVIDTSTGTQVGTTFTVTSAALSGQLLSADGTHEVITTTTGNLFIGTTGVAVIDTITGAQTSTTLFGYQSVEPLISADGKKAVITTSLFFIATQVAILKIV